MTTASNYYIEPFTGTVDTYENWRAGYEAAASRGTLEEEGWLSSWDTHLEAGRLIEVVANVEGKADYDDAYGEWRPVDVPTIS